MVDSKTKEKICELLTDVNASCFRTLLELVKDNEPEQKQKVISGNWSNTSIKPDIRSEEEIETKNKTLAPNDNCRVCSRKYGSEECWGCCSPKYKGFTVKNLEA